MVRRALAMLVAAVLVVFVLAGAVPIALASSSVSGDLTVDTTWTKANSPYILTGNLVVSSGVTLTIEAGVTVGVEGAPVNTGYTIQVDGALHARGTADDPISMYLGNGGITFSESSVSWNEATGAGCILEYAVLEHVSISISSSLLMLKTVINGPQAHDVINIYAGSPQILNNTITGGLDSVHVIRIQGSDSSPTISKNRITAFVDNGLLGITAPSWDLSHMNRFGTAHGIKVEGGNSYISENVISRCASNAITVTAGTATIERNLIVNNVVRGIAIESDGNLVIQNNTITETREAISGAVYMTTIIYNNVYNNSEGCSGFNANAFYNWWGTADASAIEQIMSGTVNFTPFLTAPNPHALPSSIPTSSPPASPVPAQRPSKTTITAPSTVPLGTSVAITGSVQDLTGIPVFFGGFVTLHAIDTNGMILIESIVPTGDGGNFSFTWTPPALGAYTLRASFGGSPAFSSSNATTNLTVVPATSTVTPTAMASTPHSQTTAPSQIQTQVTPPPSLNWIAIAVVVAMIAVIAVAVFFVARVTRTTRQTQQEHPARKRCQTATFKTLPATPRCSSSDTPPSASSKRAEAKATPAPACTAAGRCGSFCCGR